MRLLLVLASIAACNDTTQVAPTQLNLDRPVDVAFACYGPLQLSDGTTPTTSQPLGMCDFRAGTPDANMNQPVPPGQELVGGAANNLVDYYALILQSAPGTVGIAQWTPKPAQKMVGGIGTGDVRMRDSDPATPGVNGITVGDFPIAIATDTTGCYAVTANAGSCDMSALQLDSALALAGNYRVDKISVKNASGQVIHAKPAAMAAEPQPPTLPVTGNECPMQPTGLVYVAYPGCHVVAAVDTSTGMAVAAIDYASGAAVVRDGNFTCPDECGGDAVDNSLPRPVAVSLEYDVRVGTRRLAIAVDNRPEAAIVDLDQTFKPLTVAPVAFDTANGMSSTTNIALSPQIGMGGALGTINDISPAQFQFQFVYAVANDNTIRVADVTPGRAPRECDTQIDPRYLHDNKNITQLSCLPLNDPTLPRRATARGPGIELIGDAIPTSVAITRVDVPDMDNRAAPPDPGTLIGYFAFVAVANGATYIVNVDDDAFEDFVGGPNESQPAGTNVLESAIPFDLPHQLRDSGVSRGVTAEKLASDGVTEQPTCDDLGPDPDSTGGVQGGPRSPSLPERTVPSAYISPAKVDQLPSFRQLLCTGVDEPNGKPVSELMFSAPIAVRENEYPDIRALRTDENWSLTWQGLLSLDNVAEAIDGPPIRAGTLSVDGFGLHLVDTTRPFCDAGVEPYDIVQLRGCDPTNGNGDCPIGYTCYVHPASKVLNLGACMAASEADRLADACKEFLTSLRRYTVGKTTTGELLLLPRKHILRTTPVSGCTDSMQCQKLATYADTNADATNPVNDTTVPDTRTYSCEVDPDRGPPAIKRCIETCTQDSDCVDEFVCSNGYCMEGVTPPQSCVNAPQRYDLRAHDAFTVIGSASGYLHPIIADASGNCITNPNASPLLVGRVPLSAPACDPTADPRTGRLPNGTYDADPCETTVMQTETDPAYQAGTCNLASPTTQLVTRPATALVFRNPMLTLTIVDPTYPGDQVCIGDRMGTLGDIPLVDDLFQLVFRQAAGFAVKTLTITPSFPVRAVVGPQASIWVVDDGDVLANSFQFSSTKGQVFRVESVAIGTVNTLQ